MKNRRRSVLPGRFPFYNEYITKTTDYSGGIYQMKKLYRSRTDSRLSGLCGGIAEWLAIDATIVRLILVIVALFSLGSILLIYFACILVVPKSPYGGYPFNGPHPFV
jgi:phage shock protein PspC (stress-responsive transcriptional regulator)